MTELEMFAKLPQLDEDFEISDIDIDYAPTLSRTNKEQYYVYWRGFAAKDLGVHFLANTPKEAIKNAYEWCKNNNLI